MKDGVKILFSTTTNLKKNGITNVALNLFKCISKDCQVDFVVANKADEDIVKEIECLGGKVTVLQRNIKHPFRYINQLKNICKGYDIVHIHGNSATMLLELLAAKKAGVKVRICHSHSTTCESKIIDKLCRPLFYKLTTGRLACGYESGRWLYGKRSFEVINNGIDTEKFKFNQHLRDKIREDHYLKESNKLLCHIGVFAEVKNHDFLIDVFYELVKIDDSYRLFLIGEGTLLPKIKEKVENLNLEKYVVFVGITNEVEKYLSASDIFIMPSLNEGLPLSLVEAQANGLRCIISDNITKEVNLTGLVKFVSLNDDLKKWVDEIENCDVKNRQETSKRAIQNIQENGYDTKSASKELMKYYNDLLNKDR